MLTAKFPYYYLLFIYCTHKKNWVKKNSTGAANNMKVMWLEGLIVSYLYRLFNSMCLMDWVSDLLTHIEDEVDTKSRHWFKVSCSIIRDYIRTLATPMTSSLITKPRSYHRGFFDDF